MQRLLCSVLMPLSLIALLPALQDEMRQGLSYFH